MRTGTCPKCGTSEIRVIAGESRIGNTLPFGFFASAILDIHVCRSCGYLEYYVRDPEKLEEIARKWPAEES